MNIFPNSIKVLCAMKALSVASDETLKRFATSLLDDPNDQDLISVAIADSQDEIRASLDSLCKPFGFSDAHNVQALECLASFISCLMVDGKISLMEGAQSIERIRRNADVPDYHELDTFAYAASEMPGRPEDREIFEKALTEEAESWAAKA